jgi:hypothetical protein
MLLLLGSERHRTPKDTNWQTKVQFGHTHRRAPVYLPWVVWTAFSCVVCIIILIGVLIHSFEAFL